MARRFDMAYFRSSLRELVAEVERRPPASPFAQRLPGRRRAAGLVAAPLLPRLRHAPLGQQPALRGVPGHRAGRPAERVLPRAPVAHAGRPLEHRRLQPLPAGAVRQDLDPQRGLRGEGLADDLPSLLAALRDLPGLERLESHALPAAAFPNLRYVWLSRADKICIAISWERAVQTGLWTDSGEQLPIVPARPRFEKRAIQARLDELERGEANWWQLFERAGVKPVQVGYEELVADYEATADACSSSSASSCRPISGSRHGSCAPWRTRPAALGGALRPAAGAGS